MHSHTDLSLTLFSTFFCILSRLILVSPLSPPWAGPLVFVSYLLPFSFPAPGWSASGGNFPRVYLHLPRSPSKGFSRLLTDLPPLVQLYYPAAPSVRVCNRSISIFQTLTALPHSPKALSSAGPKQSRSSASGYLPITSLSPTQDGSAPPLPLPSGLSAIRCNR